MLVQLCRAPVFFTFVQLLRRHFFSFSAVNKRPRKTIWRKNSTGFSFSSVIAVVVHKEKKKLGAFFFFWFRQLLLRFSGDAPYPPEEKSRNCAKTTLLLFDRDYAPRWGPFLSLSLFLFLLVFFILCSPKYSHWNANVESLFLRAETDSFSPPCSSLLLTC